MRRAVTLLLLVFAALLAPTFAEAGMDYIVRPGDSLTQIAASHGTTVAALSELNALDPDAVLLIGARLRLPGRPDPEGASYRVQAGDTLSGLAERFGTTLDGLARANRMRPGAFLLVGSTVRVPATTLDTSTKYVVRPGDTLTALAGRFGTTIEGLARVNALDPAGILEADATLKVPGATLPKAPVVKAGPSSGNPVPVLIDHWSGHYGVPHPLARAVAWMESGYQTELVSPAGAWGVMQVMPATWSFAEEVLIGRPVNRDADGNVRVGVAYLHHLLHLYDGDERLALAAYYQGPRSVDEQGVLPASDLYIADVLALSSRFS